MTKRISLLTIVTIIFLLSCPTRAFFVGCSGLSPETEKIKAISGLSPETEEIKAIFGQGKNLIVLEGIVPKMQTALETIDQGIAGIPTVYVKIKIVQALIINITKRMGEWQTLKVSEQEEKIATSIKELIKPLEQFLNLIQTFSFVIRPLITGSLLVLAQDRAWLNHIKILENSLVWRAFTANTDGQDKKDVVTFLTENVKNMDDFKNVLKELVTLFEDLLASLKPETIAKGLEVEAKLRAQKAAPKPAAATQVKK